MYMYRNALLDAKGLQLKSLPNLRNVLVFLELVLSEVPKTSQQKKQGTNKNIKQIQTMYFLDSLQWYGRGKIKFKSRMCFMFTTLRVMGKENTKKKSGS